MRYNIAIAIESNDIPETITSWEADPADPAFSMRPGDGISIAGNLYCVVHRHWSLDGEDRLFSVIVRLLEGV